MPNKSKRQKTLIKNLLNVKCVTLLPEEFNDPKLYANSQINTTIEKEIECTENIESNTELKLLKL